MTTNVLTPKRHTTDRSHRLDLLRTMLLIRHFEETAAELYSSTKIRGFLHLYVGEEAIATGVMTSLKPEDTVVATYREHGHALARGMPAEVIMAEMFGRESGCSRGRGGSMHLFDKERRFLGGNAIVGGGIPLAIGIALADKLKGRNGVTACFFGEGAVAEGEFHESLNLAVLWHLPVVFICENNGYAMGTALVKEHAATDLAARVGSYGLPSQAVDGMDVEAVEDAAGKAISAVRAGEGPQFLEMRTYRFRAHSMYDPDRYRTKEEIASWKQHGPVRTLEERMRKDHQLAQDDLAELEAEVDEVIKQAVEFADAAPLEPVDQLTRFVTSPKEAQS